MRRSGKPSATRTRVPHRTQSSAERELRHTPRGRGGRVEKQSLRARGKYARDKAIERNQITGDARDADTTADLPGLEMTAGHLCRPKSIHSCGDASLGFVTLAGLDTDEDTNIVALNLMDYLPFSPENRLPELSYCKLHAACFLFASRVTGKTNSVEQIADALRPDSDFIRLVGSPLAEDEGSATAVQYTISVAASDVKDGYEFLYERKEIFGHLLGQYFSGLESLPIPNCLNEKAHAVDEYEEGNLDVWEADD